MPWSYVPPGVPGIHITNLALAQSSTNSGPKLLRDTVRESIFGRPYVRRTHDRDPVDALLARRGLSLQTRPRRVGAGLAPRAGRDGSPDPRRRLDPRRRRRHPAGA